MSAKSDARRRLRSRRQGRQVGLLAAVWVCLVGEISLVTVVGGLLIAWLVTIVFPLPPLRYRGRLHPIRAAWLALVLLRDLAVASTRLAVVAFAGRPPRSGIIRVDLASNSDLYQVNTAELASVVPGSLVVDARRRTRSLYLHIFDMDDPAQHDEVIRNTLAIERRVVHAFGTRAERDQVDAAWRAGEAP